MPIRRSGVASAFSSAAQGGGEGGDSQLELAAAALSDGQSATFAAGAQSAWTLDVLEWQTAFFHDVAHRRLHLMGKPVGDTAWAHQYYDLDAGAWTVVSNGMWNNPGHIYGNFAMDFALGDLFCARGGMDGNGIDQPKRVGWWKWSTATWGYAPAVGDIYAGGLDSHSNGVAVHPNLYGAGDSGLVVEQQFRTLFWRKSTDAVEDVAHGTAQYGGKEGVGCYWPAANAVFVGGSDGGALLRVTPNGGATPILTSMGVPPMDLGGHSRLNVPPFGSLHVHPGNPNKLLILQTNGPACYESSNGSAWTQLADHPFTRVPRVICSALGVCWAIGRDATGNFSTLWKPSA